MSYFDIYRQRVNRFGNDYQSRIQGAREYNFDLYLLKSVYRVDFEYDGKYHAGSLERYKQDNTETRQYLLTNVDLNIPGGTVLQIIPKYLMRSIHILKLTIPLMAALGTANADHVFTILMFAGTAVHTETSNKPSTDFC